MPAATTHIEFAKDVLRTLDEEQRRKITNLHMFWLGSQGPDMLFFSKASILPGSLHKYGNLMHNAKVAKVMDFFEHWSADDPDLYSYYMGFLCHYALDSTAHPLINAVEVQQSCFARCTAGIGKILPVDQCIDQAAFTGIGTAGKDSFRQIFRWPLALLCPGKQKFCFMVLHLI